MSIIEVKKNIFKNFIFVNNNMNLQRLKVVIPLTKNYFYIFSQLLLHLYHIKKNKLFIMKIK
jgi:hypothetical protein